MSRPAPAARSAPQPLRQRPTGSEAGPPCRTVDGVAGPGPQSKQNVVRAATVRASKGATRSQRFAMVLFVLLTMAQPVLGLVGARSSDGGCGAASQACCCALPAEAPVQATPDAGGCSCRADPLPVQRTDPAIAPRAGGATGEGSASEWVRVHAELFAHTLGGPPGAFLPPELGGEPPGAVASRRGEPCPGRAPCASAWTLLTRGVGGLLAVLSVARL